MFMPRNSIRQLLEIFWTFFKIGPSTFGGGYAMISVIEQEVVEKNKWMSESEMADVLSLAGSAPGGIGVNASAFIGYRLAGFWGASLAVLGITLPTFFIVLLLSLTYSFFHSNPKIAAAMQGVHAAIIALMVVAAYKMGKTAILDKTTLAAAVCTVIVLFTTNIHPLLIIVFGLFIGIIFVQIKKKLGIIVQLEKDKGASSGSFKYEDYFIAEGI
jgi:chromate transporter